MFAIALTAFASFPTLVRAEDARARIRADAVADRDADAGTHVTYGDGIYRSHDGGKTWNHLGLEKTYAISKISLDPRNPQIAVVAALGDPFKASLDCGIYRTIDGGKTRTKTTTITEVEGEERGALPLVALPPPKPTRRVAFAGIAGGELRPSSGYAFVRTQRHAAALAEAISSNAPIRHRDQPLSAFGRCSARDVAESCPRRTGVLHETLCERPARCDGALPFR